MLLDDPTRALDDMPLFLYSKDSLQQRLDEYATYEGVQKGSLDKRQSFKTRDDMLERIRQFAPLNQLDGAWVRNVARAGPIDEVAALLFSVWMDEVGDGDPNQNHANVYGNLLEQVGIHLPPINTADYAYDSRFLDSAYTVPMFELAISQFTDTFYPEILGMTLQLEWEVLALWPTVKLLRHFGIDSHFYELHIGIDNAANGHGAKARDAVNRFLDEAYRRGGDAGIQTIWRRIWTTTSPSQPPEPWGRPARCSNNAIRKPRRRTRSCDHAGRKNTAVAITATSWSPASGSTTCSDRTLWPWCNRAHGPASLQAPSLSSPASGPMYKVFWTPSYRRSRIGRVSRRIHPPGRNRPVS